MSQEARLPGVQVAAEPLQQMDEENEEGFEVMWRKAQGARKSVFPLDPIALHESEWHPYRGRIDTLSSQASRH
jgi:hypothetical protein